MLVKITRADKLLFPRAGISKRELIDYYSNVAPYMLPHVRNRPVTMHRFPGGVEGETFFQKDRPDYFPEWIESRPVRKEGGTVDMVMINNAETLLYLANQVTVPHVWLSRYDKPDYPDRMIFDLDPSGGSFESVKEGALQVRDYLKDRFDLASCAMLTGSRGIHVLVPLRREKPFDEVRRFAAAVSELLAESRPDRFTTEMRKKERGGRIFLDYLRNAYAQTGVAPYAVRAIERAPVAVPVEWNELEEIESSGAFTIRSVPDRLRSTGDPWHTIARRGQSLNAPFRELGPESR